VFAATQRLKHLTGMFDIARFPQYPAVAFGYGVASQHEPFITPAGDVCRFLACQTRHQIGRRLANSPAALCGIARRKYDKLVPGRQQ
jgi:hypothetical protein